MYGVHWKCISKNEQWSCFPTGSMKCEFQIEIMKCSLAYVSTKWLVQSSSSSLDSFFVRLVSWVLLHSMQPQASVHDITFFRQEHLPPTQWHLRQLQLMNFKSAIGAVCWSIQWMWPSNTSQPCMYVYIYSPTWIYKSIQWQWKSSPIGSYYQ